MNAHNPNDHIQNEWVGGYFYETIAGSRQGMLNYIYHNLRHLSDGVWVDAGAKVGNDTVFFSAICGASRILAIEPAVANLAVLNANLKVNEIESVDVFDCAIGAAAGIFPMAIANDENYDPGEAIAGDNAKMRTMDSITAGYDAPIRLIKIDVKGFNMQVLEGSVETLERNRPVVFVACADTIELVSVNDVMVRFGYELVRGLILNFTPTYMWRPSAS